MLGVKHKGAGLRRAYKWSETDVESIIRRIFNSFLASRLV
jgi:hypothetical protein